MTQGDDDEIRFADDDEDDVRVPGSARHNEQVRQQSVTRQTPVWCLVSGHILKVHHTGGVGVRGEMRQRVVCGLHVDGVYTWMRTKVMFGCQAVYSRWMLFQSYYCGFQQYSK